MNTRRVLALLSLCAWWNSTTSQALVQRAVTGAAPAAGIAGAWKVNPVVEVAQTVACRFASCQQLSAGGLLVVNYVS